MENNNEKRPRRQRISAGDRQQSVYSSKTGSSSRSFGASKPYGERKSYGEKPYGERRSYGENKPYGERKSFGDNKPYGERKSYGDKPYGERKSFGEGKPYGEKRSFGENRPYGERKSYGDKPRGERKSFGEGKPYGEKRSFGERKSFGDKKFAPKKPGFAMSQRKPENEMINKMIDERNSKVMAEFSDNDTVNIPVKDVVRLNKFIANSGICSRREADNYILAGVVTVNGEVVTELGSKINIYTDDIRFNGERLKGEEKIYIVMNKPKGFVTTASDPHADKTVMDLLKGCRSRVFAVGRLDKSTTGVLMFTNDGEMAEKLTHPSYDKRKIYQVSLDHDLKKEDYDKVLAGIELTDGPIAADDLQYIDENDKRKVGIEIHSGKNRIVRRIFESLGYDVKGLDRVYFAGLTKKGLKRGEWRYLTEGEINILKIGAYR